MIYIYRIYGYLGSVILTIEYQNPTLLIGYGKYQWDIGKYFF